MTRRGRDRLASSFAWVCLCGCSASSSGGGTNASTDTPTRAPPATLLAPPSDGDALGSLAGEARIQALLETDAGDVHCTLDRGHAPHAVALFVGLASGRAPWLDPRTGEPSRAPLYRALIFHRGIANVLVQSGCPVGDGSGSPGYRIALEPGPDDARRLAEPGVLFLAPYTAPPFRSDPSPPPPGKVLGSQFAIGLVPMDHLAGTVSVLGVCRDLERVRALAAGAAAARAARDGTTDGAGATHAPPRLYAVRVAREIEGDPPTPAPDAAPHRER